MPPINKRSSRNHRARSWWLEPFLFWAWIALLMWMPIPLGSNRPWAWAILQVGVFALVATWLLAWWRGAAPAPAPLRAARAYLLLLALWLLYEALYFVPLPPALLGGLSAEAARIHALAGGLGPDGVGTWHGFSA